MKNLEVKPFRDTYWLWVLILGAILGLTIAAFAASDTWDDWMDRYKRYDSKGVGLGLWFDGAQDLKSVTVDDGESINTPQIEVRNSIRLHRIDSVDDLPADLESGEADFFLMNYQGENLLLRKHAGAWIAALVIDSTTDSVAADAWKAAPETDVLGLRYQDGETTWYLRFDVS